MVSPMGKICKGEEGAGGAQGIEELTWTPAVGSARVEDHRSVAELVTGAR